MKKSLRIAILAGGIFNLLFTLFHLFLCYQIHQFYSTLPVYPLLQMFAIGGTIMIFIMMYTSLFMPGELVSTRVGRAMVVLNILVYGSRTVEEFVLSPVVSPAIVVTCVVMTLLYGYILYEAKTDSTVKAEIRESAAAS